MSERASQLLREVLALQLAERIELADRLEASIEEELPPFPSVSEEEEHAELLRRLEMVENGTAELVPFDLAMSQIRKELDRRRAERTKPCP